MTNDRELPHGWTMATVGDLATYQNGRAFKPSEWRTKGLPIIRIQNLNDSTAAYNYSEDGHEERFKVRHGDLLFAWSASLGAHIWRGQDAWLNQHIFRVDHAKLIDRGFLFYALLHITNTLYSKAHGSGMVHVTKGTFEETEVGLPPLNEQRRIAEKIDEVVSELDAGIENLKKARAQLTTYRQAILKHAFEGKLTAQWREGNKHRFELPESPLARISRARVERYERQLRDWRISVNEWEDGGRVGKRPRRPAPLRALSPLREPEIDRLPKLPAEWAYFRLGLLIDEPNYGTSKKCDYNYVGTGVLRIPNVVDGMINTDDLKGAHFEDDDMSTFSLAEGDILMIRSNGSISIVGKSALVSEAQKEYLYAGYLMRLSSNRCVIIPQYLHLALENHFVRMQIEQRAKSTSGVNNINAHEVQSLVVPLCSVSEQCVVVKQLAKKLSVIDALDRETKDQMSATGVLRQAILMRAFSGQLVSQDPSDGPASVLLDRIKAEREQIVSVAMPRKTGMRKKTKVKA